jgi:hypothetical protein
VILGMIILMLITIVPVKIGAEIFRSDNPGIKPCILAVVIGTILALISAAIFGDFGFIAAYITVSIFYGKIIQFSFLGSLGFTLVVLLIQVGIIQGLRDIGLYGIV